MRKLLWWSFAVLLTIPYICCGLLYEVLRRIVALFEVLENLIERLQHWAYRVPKDYFYNSPFKKTLKQVYRESLDR